MKQGPGGIRGFLLKRRRKGEECPRCLDPYTGDVLDSKCPVCRGTKYVTGYYKALPCQYADVKHGEVSEEVTDGPEGWSLTTSARAYLLAAPQLATGDVWVDADSDLRYYIAKVTEVLRVRGVSVVVSADLAQLPFDNEIYRIPLEGT
jgi:hypothetical protein